MYFTDGETEVLLPKSEIPADWAVGVEADLFLYRDSEDRRTATRLEPLLQRGEIGLLEVADVNAAGAFVRWGLRKDLLIPRGEQSEALRPGQKVWVVVLCDESTDRLFGSTKLAGAFHRDLAVFETGQEVTIQVWRSHPVGWSVIVNRAWQGILYKNETTENLRPGEEKRAWISALRDDGKIDVRLRPQGFEAGNPDAEERILSALKLAGGRLTLTDKAAPEEIRRLLGLSKKSFKTACGTLGRKGLIRWDDEALILTKANES